MPDRKPTSEQIAATARQLVDDKRVIAAGFEEYRKRVIPANAPQIQIDETRLGFYAGAHVIFSVLINMLDDDHEPTEADMRRMSALAEELAAYDAQLREVIRRRNSRES